VYCFGNLSREGTPELDIAGVQVMNLRLFGGKGHNRLKLTGGNCAVFRKRL